MRRRLALATALLGEPSVLVLDEPSNGLDPAGIVWLREFLRAFAGRGGTVLLSSHVLTELQHSIDDLVLIDRGRVAWSGPLDEFTGAASSLESAFLAHTMEVHP
jgi:ABC-2 type transport system ATP-binding protein